MACLCEGSALNSSIMSMRKHTLAIVFLFLFCGLVAAVPSLAMQEGVAVVVNEDAITYSDVEDRTNLIIASSGLPNSRDTREKLRPQIVNSLIEEAIRLQEARRLEIEVSPQEIEEGIDQIAQQNGAEPQDFRKRLQSAGLKISTMRDQVRAQLAWNKVVRAEIRPQVNVSDNDVDNYLERVQNNAGKEEYLVAEIFLPIDGENTETKSRNLARKLVQEIRTGKAPFFRVAQQFSKSAGATQGGDLGWVTQGQLDDEVDAVLPLIEKNSVSDPIRASNGFHIIFMRDKRVFTSENLPSREEVRARIGTVRMERHAQRYMLDLKSASFIDNRLAL